MMTESGIPTDDDAPSRRPPGAAWLACLLGGAIAGLTALGLLLIACGG